MLRITKPEGRGRVTPLLGLGLPVALATGHGDTPPETLVETARTGRPVTSQATPYTPETHRHDVRRLLSFGVVAGQATPVAVVRPVLARAPVRVAGRVVAAGPTVVAPVRRQAAVTVLETFGT